MKIKETLQLMAELIKNKGHKPDYRICQSILCDTLHCSKLFLVTNLNKDIDDKLIGKAVNLTQEFCSGKPLEYIINQSNFMSLPFYVDENVLIPRDDTESLVEYAINNFSGNKVLELCTGSGCISVSLAYYISNIEIDALDISENAIKIAKYNAELNGISDKIKFSVFDVFGDLSLNFGKYDMIISNPPYIKTDIIDSLQVQVKDFEPKLALDGGSDGLKFYRRICKIAEKHMNPQSTIILEIADLKQANEVNLILKKSGHFTDISIRNDLSGNERMVTATFSPYRI